MLAVVGKLEHNLVIYLHRLNLHCLYRKVFTTKKKNVKAAYAIGGNANKREMFSRKCRGHTSNFASLQHSSHKEQSIYEPSLVYFFPVNLLTTYCFLISVNSN